MFDNICEFLAEGFPEDFASWWLEEPITMTWVSAQIEVILKVLHPCGMISRGIVLF
jgi:predicted transposase YdaD